MKWHETFQRKGTPMHSSRCCIAGIQASYSPVDHVIESKVTSKSMSHNPSSLLRRWLHIKHAVQEPLFRHDDLDVSPRIIHEKDNTPELTMTAATNTQKNKSRSCSLNGWALWFLSSWWYFCGHPGKHIQPDHHRRLPGKGEGWIRGPCQVQQSRVKSNVLSSFSLPFFWS